MWHAGGIHQANRSHNARSTCVREGPSGSSTAPGANQFAGVYREIAPPRHLVFEAMGAIGRVILDETGGKTFLTVRIECGSAERLEQYLKMGIDTGTAKTLDNLAAHIGAMAQRTSSSPSTAPSSGG